MAQTSKKTTTASKNKKSASPAGRKKTQEPQKAPKRREIAAIVFLLLGVFSLLGYFSSDGAFIGFFCGLIKGLVGGGFFAIAPLLFLAAAVLCFHRGRPVRFRVMCCMLLAVDIGAIVHLFASGEEYSFSFKMLGNLWESGKELSSGGVISGFLSEMFSYLFSDAGAAVVFFCVGAFLLLASLNRTISGIYDTFKNRERRAYEVVTEPENDDKKKRGERHADMPAPAPRRGRKIIDIPMDDEPVAAYEAAPEKPPLEIPLPPENKPLFNNIPGVKTPDQVIAAYSDIIEEPETVADNGEDVQEDIPLDISFMERGTPKKTRTQPRAAAPQPQPESKPEPVAESEVSRPETAVNDEKGSLSSQNKSAYAYPPIELLSAGTASGRVDGSEEVRLNSERLEAAFLSFGVRVAISNATRGPTVTRYEAELEAGVKLNKLTSLADDIALSLGASGVRIAAMPNKISTVGIEVPNKLVSKVLLRDIIESQEFKGAKSKLTFSVGKNIGGEAVVGNIAKLPHMLVAGTTGSGKSVCLNSLILSILYKATPDEVRFIMIDPKMVEFRVYNGIPHLLVPVVTDVKKAAGALQWAVVEMMKRYRMFSETNARDLEGYNQIMRSTEEGPVLPQVVVVIDELADLMLTAAKEVEESICRVAQMGRAAGVHLVIATQSPRADVITGLMKANIPSRIALKVSSALESRIILDAGGNADKLVGNGDMLFAPIGSAKPIRIQGTWVTDEEREAVVEFIKKSGETQYSEEVISQIEKAAEDKPSGNGKREDAAPENDYDELLPQAVDVIFETGQASVSMLQRRLKLGYSRAARIVDQMEQMGIVGPFEGSKPRQLLITKERWREMQYINGTAPADSGMPDIPADDFSYADDEE